MRRYTKAVIAFLSASLFILFFIPVNGNFKYEFTQGQVWQYDDLVAPFDFPVYKTDSELSEERKKVAELSLNYFTTDTLTVLKQLNSLKDRLGDAGQFALFESLFDFIYRRGILDDAKSAELKGKNIAIVKGGSYREMPASELFSQTSACEYAQSRILQSGVKIDEQNIAQYIAPNLSFNEALTAKIRQKNLDAVLPTEGIISEGVKIIYRGDIVTSETARILSSLKKEYTKNTVSGNLFMIILGRLFFILMCMACIFILLVSFRSAMLIDDKCLLFIVGLLTFFTIVALQISKIQPSAVYAVPLTIVPIYISSFFYSRPAIYIHFFIILITGGFVSAGFEFVLINSLVGVTAVIGFKKSYDRRQLFLTGFFMFTVYLAAYVSLKLLHEGSFADIDSSMIGFFMINCLLVIILYQFTFLFERLFGFVSVSRLVELSDTSRRLFRELTETAPGTAQHAIQVANIAETVIREIGDGDPFLVRAGALYHDIGKMKNPACFIENKISNHNPHDKISAEESAGIIIEHVKYGVELAHKYHLPGAIIDFIKTHHGKSRTHYFYMKHLNEFPEDKDIKDIEDRYTYPGPNPSSKEMVAVMMVDACEAASRSLPHPDEPSLNSLVDKIVERQYSEGLYNESDITLKEINIAKQVIKNKLKNIYHARIEYPEN
ncbi:MAG: HDIG domain-containing protein [Prevotellaceae bacterium]|jgi:putative nucleotidyltransferase with HDIG domain|nr:HDIG domain-containing protein [Prevotellaceae bacterium]